MGKRGRKPKATAAKRKAGNPGKRPLNQQEPQPGDGSNEPPAYLSDLASAAWVATFGKEAPETLRDVAASEWRRIVDEMRRESCYTTWDQAMVEVYCVHYAIWRTCVEAIKEKGVLHNVTSETRQQVQVLLKVLPELGFTPSSRSQIKRGAEHPELTSFEKHRLKKDQREAKRRAELSRGAGNEGE